MREPGAFSQNQQETARGAVGAGEDPHRPAYLGALAPGHRWPEIFWRDPRSPGHLGNVPHVWIGAEYVLALLAMLAHERPADGALVLAAGVSSAWLDAGEVAVQGLPTW